MATDTSPTAVPAESIRFEFRHVHISDELVVPLLDELAHEYSSRYGRALDEQVRVLAEEYPPEEFSPPGGAVVVLLRDGLPVAGGAFRRYDAETAELKRMWTRSGHRRRGLGRRVVEELERVARLRGYRRAYLTTGWRQPEAKALYLAAGYSPLFDITRDPAEIAAPLPFEKRLEGP
ncbi:GNAT family N-acetyltransferase [Saccharopolyspora taberi]|uniref:GNAT family N-acetyltransferase n=1 Tax=Saccharopolyspora taberi TaxID=60895 RepID=A0ABN3VES3_9PSEU